MAFRDVDVCLGGGPAGKCASSLDEKRLTNTNLFHISPEAAWGRRGGLVFLYVDVAISVANDYAILNMIHAVMTLSILLEVIPHGRKGLPSIRGDKLFCLRSWT